VLAAGTTAQASLSALGLGLPVLVPALREEFGLSLAEVGVVLAAEWIGALLTLLPWGLAADRYGERGVLTSGLLGCALCLAAAAYASSFVSLVLLLGLAGASGASVNSASGRAVMHWFDADERGFALGLRQTAIPVGGVTGALLLPVLVEAGGIEAAFLFLAVFCCVGALVGAILLRGRELDDGVEPATLVQTLRDARLWRVCLGSGIYLYAQVALIGFGVLFLHDEHGFSDRRAGYVLAASQLVAVALRTGAGRWSDILRSRIVPLRRLGLAIAGGMATTAVLAGGPVWLLAPALAVAGGLSMGWNGLSFAAAAEIGGARRSGAAIGIQQSVLCVIGVAGPVLFATTVASMTWAAAFALAALPPLVGWVAHRPLRK
jgi:MFS family permease